MNDIKKLRRLMRTANELKKINRTVISRNAVVTQSFALKYAWWFEKFRQKLQTGMLNFTYLKTDGTIREATGTLRMDLIPEEHRPKGDMSDGAAREPQAGVFVYYDIVAKGWRSFRCENFIGFIEQVY